MNEEAPSPPEEKSARDTAADDMAARDVVKKPGRLGVLWGKLGLDKGTVIMMFKGSVAPTIAVSFYQADSVAATYGTLGYLVPIISIISMPIMPRAKFFQTILLDILGTCIGASIALLGIWSGIQARNNTTDPNSTSTSTYNSSQSAICAIWLFANIYFVNVFRAKVPALSLPVIMYSIFTNVAFTFGPQFTMMSQGVALIVMLLKGFLTAFAIAIGVNLFVIPISCRTVVFKEQAGFIQAVRGVLKAQTAYLQSMESNDMFSSANILKDDADGTLDEAQKRPANPATSSEAAALNGAIKGLRGLVGKMFADLPLGKREIAWGKLDGNDLQAIHERLRDIFVPLFGMTTITDIFERIAERRGWTQSADKIPGQKWEQVPLAEKIEEQRIWNEVMKALHEPFAVITAAMDEGLVHAGINLELLPRPKQKATDVEADADPVPGDPKFSQHLEQRLLNFYKQRGKALRRWAKEKGLTAEDFNNATLPPFERENLTKTEAAHRRDQQQLYLILFLEHLLFETGMAVTRLIKYSDSKVEDGTMKKNRLILPGQRRIMKWIKNFGSEDAIDSESPDMSEGGINAIHLGSGFNARKDPEHLAPNTAWQRFGNAVRIIPRFLASQESTFGFRVACATLTVGIVAFLENTNRFFLEQRLVWAMIIIAIGMSVTSGQSVFGFVSRVVGTFGAMVVSFIIWYIVDEKTAGIIVFLWLFTFLEMYLFLKFPRFLQGAILLMVTQVLIIDYELQVRKIGVAASTASGQPAYPIYILGPYRLATTAGGCLVAFIWTFFPYPLTDRSWLRQGLGSTLFLLANFHAAVNSTIHSRFHGLEGDMSQDLSPGRRLEHIRYKMFGKLILIIPSLQEHADWQKWEPTIGGKFPREPYEAIIRSCQNILSYLSLMAYATRTFSDNHSDEKLPNSQPETRGQWIKDLTGLMDTLEPTTHQITSTLSLLSASVSQGSALPPYIVLPEPHDLSRRLEALDSGILDTKHVEEPGYSAYAVLQVASSLVIDDVHRLVDAVKELVGETDFSLGGAQKAGKGKRE